MVILKDVNLTQTEWPFTFLFFFHGCVARMLFFFISALERSTLPVRITVTCGIRSWGSFLMYFLNTQLGDTPADIDSVFHVPFQLFSLVFVAV